MTAPPLTRSPKTSPDAAQRWAQQMGFDEMGDLLREATFCVVDLETTGGSAAAGSMITEIGAVKVRGGEVLGEFQTLVNPNTAIPAFIAVLTGITNSMVASAPPISAALPAFLEFARGSVLVAHNAPFDVGFLKHFATELGIPWPGFAVIDTAKVARRVVTKDESPNCKLASLARVFGSATTPNHRALADARATVDVLHGLIERLGSLGVHTVDELADFSSRVSEAQRRKRHLAAGVPSAPGVYLFKDASGRVLYVGTSKNLRARVRSYFTTAETRSRIGEMINLAESVDVVVCSSALEASVRELRLIAAHKPPYNRRSKFPEKVQWIKLTDEPWPRLSLVRQVQSDGCTYLGPFSSRRTAQSALDALHQTFQIRQCSQRMPRNPLLTPCVLAELGRCLAPCTGEVDHATYASEVQRVREVFIGSPESVVAAETAAMMRLSAQQRYESARTHRDRLLTLLRAASRTQRLIGVTQVADLVAARREPGVGWVVHVVRHGRLAAAGVIPPQAHAGDYVTELRISADSVTSGVGPTPAATAEETEQILRWLESEGTRVVHIDGSWSYPIGSAIAAHERYAHAKLTP